MPIFKRQIVAFDDEVEILAGINLQTLWDRMLGEFLGEYERVSRQGLSDEEVEKHMQAFMDDLSEKPQEVQARQSATVAYSEGRDAATQSAKQAGLAQYVVRSEVLDTATCRPCQVLDGEVFEIGSSEYFANMPPAQCDGGDNCRGFYIPVRN